MNLRPLFFSLFSCIMIFSLSVNATTISPFPNLGEMAKACDAVVLAKALRNYTVEEGLHTRFRTSLQVIENVKGTLAPSDQFVLQNYHLKVDDLERIVWGDIELQEGYNYLLFLHLMDNGLWQAQMLSYAAFEEHSRAGQKVLVPFDLGTEVHLHFSANQPKAEPLAVYATQKLLPMLRNVLQTSQNWDGEKVATPYKPESFEAGYRGVPPGHCTFLSGTPYARWPNFETTSLPVWFHQDGDPGCPTASAEIAAAIGNVNSNYLGVNLSNAGTHSFVPTCGGGQGAADGEFTDWIDNNLGSTRNHLIMFDDPCSEIPDLVGCSGTLAFGGLYWFSSTHMADGMTWRNAAYGYMVVNNGTGTCQCTGGSDYEIMLTHELTHSLNIGHIASGTGVANMNPSCCNAITTLDVQCLDFVYAPPALPVEVISFKGAVKDKVIALEWISSSETNNDFYMLERQNKAGEFVPLEKVKSYGNSFQNQAYQHLDQQPEIGTNYYRLSQTDLDGSLQILETIAVDYFDQLRIDIYPNPLGNAYLQSSISTESKGTAQIDIYDLTGQLVWSQQELLEQGKNQLEWNLDALPKGLYIFKITQHQQTKMIRFVKS